MSRYIDFGAGEPDFLSSGYVLRAVFEEAVEGNTRHSPTGGVPKLRWALGQRAYKGYGLRYDTDSEVLVTAGGAEAFFLATLVAWLSPGEEVPIFDPRFVVYEPGGLLAEKEPVHVPKLEASDFWPS